MTKVAFLVTTPIKIKKWVYYLILMVLIKFMG